MDTSSPKNIRPIDVLGLKNFRIFNDQMGFKDELTAINILTGANNSGKSSIVKALQLLRNSVAGEKYPFNLDLNQQEHLLGDFGNILNNKDNRQLEITLPYLFMGIKNFFISLTFESAGAANTYDARLRKIHIIDRTDDQTLFSFQYTDATQDEKISDKAAYEKKQDAYKKQLVENSGKDVNIFNAASFYNLEPFENPLSGYVKWHINLKKLKHYLNELGKVYKIYLKNKKLWSADGFKEINEIAKDLYIVPSSLINSFKTDVDFENWKKFAEENIKGEGELSGREKVGERDFDSEDYLIPPYEIEHIIFHKASEVLKANLKWKERDNYENEYSVFANCFSNGWEDLLKRITAINYVSNIKEENARSYNATANSPFIQLLKSYSKSDHDSEFTNRYLKAFEIGNKISVELNPKHQSILVSISTLDGTQRDLVDFGYGIKQLVHILMQINVLAQKNKRSEHIYDYDERIEDTYVPSLLIIEEPESNLHPKWQSLLADMLAEANRRFNIQMIIETHSEYLIRKFQTLVAIKQIAAKDVKIFYLRNLKRITIGKKQVECLFIQENGNIDFTAFDHGFFDENYNLQMSLLNVQREKFLLDFANLKKSNKESEDKILELQQRIDAYTDKVDITKYKQIISTRFDVNKLLADSVTYLVSGQYLLENIGVSGDYSPVILQYGRAIENELKRIFVPISSKKLWMLGDMQKHLENFIKQIPSNPSLLSSLVNLLNVPTRLRIDLVKDLRHVRNDAGHPGHIKLKQAAIDYIVKANEFLDNWIELLISPN